MLATVAILFLLAALAPLAIRAAGARAGVPIAAVSLGIAGWFALRFNEVVHRGPIRERFEWVPSLGVDLAFTLDGLSLMFALLICAIGAIVLLYTSSYLRDSPGLGRFYATLLAFMASMLGLVLVDNLILVYVFWELTSVTSFLLIGFDFHRERARRCAWQSLIVTGFGGLALLAGLILLAIASGGPAGPEFSISALDRAELQGSPLYIPAAVLILLGCFSKSAMVPFHFWLPNAMEAPSPVSALLHSSTMVKAGVYLVARLHPAMGDTGVWDNALVVFGGATMLLGAFLATRHVEFKRILAYSTVSSLGIMVMLIGLHAYAAAATYLIAHALFKACLFLVAGSAIHSAGTKDTETIGHLRRRMPITAIAAVLGGLSLAGMVPFLGFAGKELVLKATLYNEELAYLIVPAAALSALLTVLAALQVAFKPFFMGGDEASDAHESAWPEWSGPLALGALGLAFGLVPGLFLSPLVESVVIAASGAPMEVPLKLNLIDLVRPVTLPLVLSIGALAGGGLLFIFRRRYRAALQPVWAFDAVGPERTYDRLLSGVLLLASRLTRTLQNGSLRIYVRTVVLTTTGLVALALWRIDGVYQLFPDLSRLTPFDCMLALTIVASAVSATMIRSRLGAIAALSGIGFSLAIYFILHGAPDVAGTQFAVETLIVVIFVLVTHRLPRFAKYTRNLSRSLDIAIAVGLGCVVTVLALIAMGTEVADPISAFHASESVGQAYGRNVINVILVDYRAMDTLGEILVLTVASIGVFTLLTIRPSRAPEAAP